MAEERLVAIVLCTDEKVFNVTYCGKTTVEDLCIKVCKHLNIGPVARHLFSLRNPANGYWYYPRYVLENNFTNKFEFRLRFKPSSMRRLKKIDSHAYDYYFAQVRHDVLYNKVPDIVYERHKQELFGLGVSDMYRVMKEKNVPRETVESEYKKYFPKECIKRHHFFLKKPIHQALMRISEHDPAYVKEQYLEQFHNMAPNYPSEDYHVYLAKNIPYKIDIRVNWEGVKCRDSSDSDWKLMCTIEDLCHITIGRLCDMDNNEVAASYVMNINRKNGIPLIFKFESDFMLYSFITVLNGYYRLMFKWIFDLCSDLLTPSLEYLYKLKCHGPVGGEFSYAKLKEKRDNAAGTYIVRESETSYDSFYLDVCDCDRKPRTYKIDKTGPEEFLLIDLGKTFSSLRNIHDQISAELLYLKECLPASEYDNSPLLICAPEQIGTDITADAGIVSSVLDGGPRIIPPGQLQVFRGQPFAKTKSTMDLLRSTVPKTTLYRAVWRVVEGKKLEAAIKILKEDEWKYSKDFLDMAGKWSQLRHGAIVRLYGLTIAPAVGMVLELVKYGSLDTYLRNAPPGSIKTIDLVDAAVGLVTAVWHLEECGIVHGNIRCRKLLVHSHTERQFVVKLADPGVFNYTLADIHWLPPECYGNMESAKYNTQADVWAVATTLWEIFSHGQFIPDFSMNDYQKLYAVGRRLPIPIGCPIDVYQVMLDCWGEFGGSRKQPQAILRDINHIRFQIFNSRLSHSYASPQFITDNELKNETASTVETDIDDNSSTKSNAVAVRHDLSNGFPGYLSNRSIFDFFKYSFSECLNDINIQETMTYRAVDDGLLGRMQSIFELDTNCTVSLQHKIGQGFYGEVYLGIMEKDDNATLPIKVAVKKLKNYTNPEQDISDFQREIDIMKNLKHPNIVAILGVILEPEISLVMEYIEHGSLQSYLSIYREKLTHKKMLRFGYDIAAGMHYLGMKNIVHRDLATRNVLVTNDERAKISDFGLARFKGDDDYYYLKTQREIPIKWYAPESLHVGKFSFRSDVWSFGVTLYEIFSFGQDPKLLDGDVNNQQIYDALQQGRRLPCPEGCPSAVYNHIMCPCWNFYSQHRPTFAQLCTEINRQMNDL